MAARSVTVKVTELTLRMFRWNSISWGQSIFGAINPTGCVDLRVVECSLEKATGYPSGRRVWYMNWCTTLINYALAWLSVHVRGSSSGSTWTQTSHCCCLQDGIAAIFPWRRRPSPAPPPVSTDPLSPGKWRENPSALMTSKQRLTLRHFYNIFISDGEEVLLD